MDEAVLVGIDEGLSNRRRVARKVGLCVLGPRERKTPGSRPSLHYIGGCVTDKPGEESDHVNYIREGNKRQAQRKRLDP